MPFLKLFKFIFTKKVIFLVRYPSIMDLNDGYFQRVERMDNVFKVTSRIYLNILPGNKNHFFTLIADNCIQFNINNKKLSHIFFCVFLVLLCGCVYTHSILRLDSKLSRLIYRLGRKSIFDIHGVVPEEFGYHGDLASEKIFNEIERFACRYSYALIGVTESMLNYFKYKYKDFHMQHELFIIPMFQEQAPAYIDKRFIKNKLTIIYAGGTHKWQKIDEMLEFVWQNNHNYHFIFLVPNIDVILETYKRISGGDKFPGVIKSVAPGEVKNYYKQAHFGLVLRDNVIVNKVACPTKLVEYMLNCVVPIVDNEDIGDFQKLGYKAVNIKSKENLFDLDIEDVCRNNLAVIEKMKQIYCENVIKLKQSLGI